MRSSTDHGLYRFYSDDGRLLYVGISKNPGKRFDQHSQEKSWWPEVRGITVEWYPDRESVVSAERRAIEIERPRYNIQRPSLPAADQADFEGLRDLAWICEACKAAVVNGEGYIHVSHDTVNATERAYRDFERRESGKAVTLDSLLALPDPARWRVHHVRCDPEPDSADYVIEVHRARTHAQLLRWTAHLMGKEWLRYTDWDELIDRMAAVEQQ